MKYPNLSNIREIEIAENFKIRIYTSDEDENNERYHIGYAKEMLPAILKLLAESEPYMGNSAHAEIDGFYVYRLSILKPTGSDFPQEEIDKAFRFDCQMIRNAARFLEK